MDYTYCILKKETLTFTFEIRFSSKFDQKVLYAISFQQYIKPLKSIMSSQDKDTIFINTEVSEVSWHFFFIFYHIHFYKITIEFFSSFNNCKLIEVKKYFYFYFSEVFYK